MSTQNLELDANTIITAKRRRLAMRQDQTPANAVIALANMQKGSQSILTEVMNRDDPVKVIGQIRHDEIYDPVGTALRFMRHGIDAVSLFTDGKIYSRGMEDLTFLSKGINKGIIAQDYILNAYHVAEVRAAGASGLVIYSSHLDYNQIRDIVSNTMRWRMTAIVQVSNLDQLADVARLSPHGIAIGDHHTFEAERDIELMHDLLPHMPANTRVMPLGCLMTMEDVEAVVALGVDAITIDESILRAKNQPEYLQEVIQNRPH